jgi:hypothetical protein
MAGLRVPWPVRSTLAGIAGTATLTLSYDVERRLRSRRGPLDYDDSLVPGQLVASIMHLPQVTGREERDLGLESDAAAVALARRVIATSLGTHLAYVASATTVDDALARLAS